jgi:hypothetical protein
MVRYVSAELHFASSEFGFLFPGRQDVQIFGVRDMRSAFHFRLDISKNLSSKFLVLRCYHYTALISLREAYAIISVCNSGSLCVSSSIISLEPMKHN